MSGLAKAQHVGAKVKFDVRGLSNNLVTKPHRVDVSSSGFGWFESMGLFFRWSWNTGKTPETPTQQTIHAEVKRKTKQKGSKTSLEIFCHKNPGCILPSAMGFWKMRDLRPNMRYPELVRKMKCPTIHVQYYKVLTPVVNKKRGVSLKFKNQLFPHPKKKIIWKTPPAFAQHFVSFTPGKPIHSPHFAEPYRPLLTLVS